MAEDKMRPNQGQGEIVIYQAEDGLTKVECRFVDETVWLTQQQMAELFHTSRSNIVEHIGHIYEEGELDETSTCRKFRQVRMEGNRQVTRELPFYNLDMIISLGYRVKSLIATQFRRWATERLKEYMIKGFTMDDERLKNLGGGNCGFAPYGYQLVDGKLIINEEEAEAIRVIYDQYVHTDIGANGIAKYLENHGIRKIPRQNGKNPLFDAHLIRLILKNPVYCGKIAYGRRKTEKVRGTRNEYKLVEQDNYLLADGQHEAIVSEEVWQAAQVKLLAQAKKYEHVNRGKDEHVHLLSGIVKCPVCGAGMYGNKSIKHKADGTKYKDFYYYGCKHRTMIRGHKCDYKKQIREELLDDAVAEVIVKLVSNPKFAAMMQEKINMKVDTAAIDQEIANYEKQLRQHYSIKSKLAEEIDSLDPDDRHYVRRKADLDDRLYRMYDKIEDTESSLIAARAKKQAIEAEKLTGDNIYKVLIYFEKLYGVMNDVERRQLIEALISEIQIYPERQPNGQWLKSIKFKLPIIEEDMSISLDNEEQVETVVLLSRETNPLTVEVRMEVETGEVKEHPTYKRIQEYVQEKYGFKVHTAYIAEVKRMVGLDMHKAPNAVEQRKHEYHPCPPEKVEAIKDALRHFGLISE